MKKLIALLWILAIVAGTFVFAGNVSYGENTGFKKQPEGGFADNNKDFTVTWETYGDVECYIQSRKDETEPWGTIEIGLRSSYVLIGEYNFSEQYRIVITDTEEKSDVFTVTWRPAENASGVEHIDIYLGDIKQGDLTDNTFPLIIKNAGEYDLTGLRPYLPDETMLELIQNKTSDRVKAGETDEETWSVKIRTNAPLGRYWENVFFEADNLTEMCNITYDFFIVEGDKELTYSAESQDVSFGTLKVDYDYPEGKKITVRATGDGTLTSVRLVPDEEAEKYFYIAIEEAYVTVSPWNDRDVWTVYFNAGLPVGEYKGKIRIYADQLTEPVVINVSAYVTEDGEPVVDQENNTGDDNTEDITENNTEENTGENKPSFNALPLIIAILSVCTVAAAAIAVTVVVVRKRRK